MLMSDGPWNPEHIYQEIVGYGKTRQRGESIISFPDEMNLYLHSDFLIPISLQFQTIESRYIK